MMVFLISNFIFANCQLSTKEYCKEYCNVECSDSLKQKKECMIKENWAELLIHTYSFTASAAVMLSHISVLFQGTTQLHNFASHDIHPTSTTHSSYLSLPFWRWIPRSYGFRTTRFSQNISSIKLGLQENSQKHIFDKPVPVSNGSFLSSFASFALEKREEEDLFSIRLWR